MSIPLRNYFSPLQTIALEADFVDRTNISFKQWERTSNDKKQLFLNNEQAVKTLLDSNKITFEQLVSFHPPLLEFFLDNPQRFIELLENGLLNSDPSKLDFEHISCLMDPHYDIVPHYLSLSEFLALDMQIIDITDGNGNDFITLFERGLQGHQFNGLSFDDIRYFVRYLSQREEIDIPTFADQILVIPKEFRIWFFQHPEHLESVSDNIEIFEELLKKMFPKEIYLSAGTAEGHQLVSYPQIFFSNIETCQLLSKNKIDLERLMTLSSARLLTIFTYPNDFLSLCDKIKIPPALLMVASVINDDNFYLLVTEQQQIDQLECTPEDLHKIISTIRTTSANCRGISNNQHWHPDVLRKLDQLGVTPPPVIQGAVNQLIQIFENYEIFMNLHRKGVDIVALFSSLSLSRIEVLLFTPEVIIRYKNRLKVLENISINDWMWNNRV